MADAWANLLVHSSLGSGDAWEHLLAQEGGSSDCEVRYVSDKALVFDMAVKSIQFDSEPIVMLWDSEEMS